MTVCCLIFFFILMVINPSFCVVYDPYMIPGFVVNETRLVLPPHVPQVEYPLLLKIDHELFAYLGGTYYNQTTRRETDRLEVFYYNTSNSRWLDRVDFLNRTLDERIIGVSTPETGRAFIVEYLSAREGDPLQMFSRDTWTWSPLFYPDTSPWRSEVGLGALRSLFFVAGGATTFTYSSKTDRVDVYHTLTDQWLSPLKLSVARSNVGVVSLGDRKILFAGGFTDADEPTNVVDIYSLTTALMTSMASSRTAIGRLGLAISNSKVLIDGGDCDSSRLAACESGTDEVESSVELYDDAVASAVPPGTLQATNVSVGFRLFRDVLSVERKYAAAALLTVGGRSFAFWGPGRRRENPATVSEFDIYDVDEDRWYTNVGRVPHGDDYPSYRPHAAAFGSRVYIGGGSAGIRQGFSDIIVYRIRPVDVASGDPAPMPSPRPYPATLWSDEPPLGPPALPRPPLSQPIPRVPGFVILPRRPTNSGANGTTSEFTVPTPTDNPALVPLSDRVMHLGGVFYNPTSRTWVGSSHVDFFDPVGLRWIKNSLSAFTAMPGNVSRPITAVCRFSDSPERSSLGHEVVFVADEEEEDEPGLLYAYRHLPFHLRGWTTIRIPHPREISQLVCYDRTLYVMGGQEFYKYVDFVDLFDAREWAWRPQRPDSPRLPTPRHLFSTLAAPDHNQLIVVGGHEIPDGSTSGRPTDRLEVFDPTLGRWDAHRTVRRAARRSLTRVADRVFIGPGVCVGSYSNCGPADMKSLWTETSSLVEVYSLSDRRVWSLGIDSLSAQRRNEVSWSVMNRYAVIGHGYDERARDIVPNVDVFDTERNSWARRQLSVDHTDGTSYRFAARDSVCVASNGLMLAAGGHYDNEPYPELLVWELLARPEPSLGGGQPYALALDAIQLPVARGAPRFHAVGDTLLAVAGGYQLNLLSEPVPSVRIDLFDLRTWAWKSPHVIATTTVSDDEWAPEAIHMTSGLASVGGAWLAVAGRSMNPVDIHVAGGVGAWYSLTTVTAGGETAAAGDAPYGLCGLGSILLVVTASHVHAYDTIVRRWLACSAPVGDQCPQPAVALPRRRAGPVSCTALDFLHLGMVSYPADQSGPVIDVLALSAQTGFADAAFAATSDPLPVSSADTTFVSSLPLLGGGAFVTLSSGAHAQLWLSEGTPTLQVDPLTNAQFPGSDAVAVIDQRFVATLVPGAAPGSSNRSAVLELFDTRSMRYHADVLRLTLTTDGASALRHAVAAAGNVLFVFGSQLQNTTAVAKRMTDASVTSFSRHIQVVEAFLPDVTPHPTAAPTHAPTHAPTSAPSPAPSAMAVTAPPSAATTALDPAVAASIAAYKERMRNTAPPPPSADDSGVLIAALLVAVGIVAACGLLWAVIIHQRRGHPSAGGQTNTGVPLDESVYSRYERTGSSVSSGSSSNIDAKYVIPASELRRKKQIGQGAFGVVYLGEWRSIEVAIKEVKLGDGKMSEKELKQEKENLMQEASKMMKLRPHLNVVTFYGLQIKPTLAVVTEFCTGGSLDHWLESPQGQAAPPARLHMIIIDVARGVHHLHREGIVHRDLAARNCLLDDANHAKVADFGMSRHHEGTDSEAETKTTVGPLKWFAPESLTRSVYSARSDVFSFGVVCYEILARSPPWANITNASAVHKVLSGERLAIPGNTPPVLAEIMQACWLADADQRPSMAAVCSRLGTWWEEKTGKKIGSGRLSRSSLSSQTNSGPTNTNGSRRISRRQSSRTSLMSSSLQQQHSGKPSGSRRSSRRQSRQVPGASNARRSQTVFGGQLPSLTATGFSATSYEEPTLEVTAVVADNGYADPPPLADTQHKSVYEEPEVAYGSTPNAK